MRKQHEMMIHSILILVGMITLILKMEIKIVPNLDFLRAILLIQICSLIMFKVFSCQLRKELKSLIGMIILPFLQLNT